MLDTDMDGKITRNDAVLIIRGIGIPGFESDFDSVLEGMNAKGLQLSFDDVLNIAISLKKTQTSLNVHFFIIIR